MLEPLKGFFRGSRGGQAGGGPPVSSAGGRTAMNARGGAMEPTLSSRSSRGLEEFFTQIRDTSGLTLLDLGGATQKNISFITDLGHRNYTRSEERRGGKECRSRGSPYHWKKRANRGKD